MKEYILEIGEFKIPSYGFFIAIGLILCILTLWFLIKKNNMPESLFDAYFTAAIIGIVVGFLSAMLFQSFYELLKTGRWHWGGLTVMGGLIGGVVGFVLYVLTFLRHKKTKQAFWDIADFASACICIAHCLGRIGCFFAGCCYGIEDNGFWAVEFDGVPRLPVQLFESLFLFMMFLFFMVYNLKKTKRGYGIGIYAISYGIWRFFIEFLRGDDRGGVQGALLSPSQVQSIVFVVVGVAVIIAVYLLTKKGLIVEKIDWSEELKIEADAKKEKEQLKQRQKAELVDGTSYEEYNDAIDIAQKEQERNEESDKDIDKA